MTEDHSTTDLASQKTYPYDELPQGDVFRYLVLQPGAGDDPLVCNLRTAPIADTPFEAVSYVWGQAIKNQSIICENHVMGITSSLSSVLRRIRLLNKPLKVWADSICIDQENLKEKGHQVALMGKIYRSAQRVLIHMESDDGGQGPAVCSLLDEVDKMVEETCKKIDMTLDSFPYSDEDDPLLVDPRWNSLHKLLSHNRFDRGWVVQEAASAPDGQILWGQSRIDWEKLMRTYIWLCTRGSSTYHAKDFGEVQINAHTEVYLESHKTFARAFYSELSWGTSSILRTLNCAKELDLSDLHDRIYAFMDLPQLTEHITLYPDYSRSYLETYQQFAIQYIQSNRNTELLDYVSHNDDSLSMIPSWIPRWDVPTWSLRISSSASSILQSRTNSIFEPVVAGNGSLKVQGVIIDTMTYVSELFDWETTTPETIRSLWDYVNTLAVPKPYYTSRESESSQLDAFFNALDCGTHDGEFAQWQQDKHMFALNVISKPILDGQNTKRSNSNPDPAVADAIDDTSNIKDYRDPIDASIFFNFIRTRTHNRKFILTARGYMGLAPAPTCKSDSCGIIFGCKTPCILRGQEKNYKFLGATALMGKHADDALGDGGVMFCTILGEEESKDWVDWDVKEQDIYLC